MVSKGDEAPAFTAPLANGDIESVSLPDALEADAPVVLAFFPGAFTRVCSHEMQTFEQRLEDVADAGGTLYGVSIDSPFALNEFRDQLSLSFDLISDVNRELIEAYDVAMDFEAVGIEDIAKRAVFVVDGDGTVTYAWVSDDPGVEPDYDEVIQAIEAASVTRT
jgi:peroxiredoxin